MSEPASSVSIAMKKWLISNLLQSTSIWRKMQTLQIKKIGFAMLFWSFNLRNILRGMFGIFEHVVWVVLIYAIVCLLFAQMHQVLTWIAYRICPMISMNEPYIWLTWEKTTNTRVPSPRATRAWWKQPRLEPVITCHYNKQFTY